LKKQVSPGRKSRRVRPGPRSRTCSCRPPPWRGSTKVCSPVCVSRPGLPAAISRISCDSAPCGKRVAFDLVGDRHVGNLRRVDEGAAHDALEQILMRENGQRRDWLPSPRPTGCTGGDVCAARARRGTAAPVPPSTPPEQHGPPPEPPTSKVSPERMTRNRLVRRYTLHCILLPVCVLRPPAFVVTALYIPTTMSATTSQDVRRKQRLSRSSREQS